MHPLVLCDEKSDKMKVDVSDQNYGVVFDIFNIREASLIDLSLAEVRLLLGHLRLP
jgi:hypothetical protein